MGIFIKNLCYDQIFAKTDSILTKTAIFSPKFLAKIFLKITTSLPTDFSVSVLIIKARPALTRTNSLRSRFLNRLFSGKKHDSLRQDRSILRKNLDL
jgi:hypothetical protein